VTANPTAEDPAALGRAIVDASDYMTLATADASGVPWASPVYFVHAAYTEFIWISKPGARHSENIAARQEVGIVIFDSTVEPGTGRGVYLRADAAELAGEEIARGLEIFNGPAHQGEQGVRLITTADVTGTGRHRLYRARPREAFVLDEHDERVPVTLR